MLTEAALITGGDRGMRQKCILLFLMGKIDKSRSSACKHLGKSIFGTTQGTWEQGRGSSAGDGFGGLLWLWQLQLRHWFLSPPSGCSVVF